MARTDRTRAEPRERAPAYRDQGRIFLDAANALASQARGNESYGSAIALLVVHASIAFTDSLTIGFAGRKSTGIHAQAGHLLTAALGARLPTTERQRLARLLSEKDSIAYQGRYYPLDEARKLLVGAQRFAAWAERIFEERPVR